ncbi:MAG: DUF749 family protein [Methanobacteriota archaeon]|nr:MAG: DUF749 family protein [Euryarchaeota archaeon]
MHVARLLAVTEVRSVPPDIRPFVDFRAAIEERELDEDEKVAILVIETTSSYIPVFIKDPISLEELERKLADQDAQLAADSRDALAPHLSQGLRQ